MYVYVSECVYRPTELLFESFQLWLSSQYQFHTSGFQENSRWFPSKLGLQWGNWEGVFLLTIHNLCPGYSGWALRQYSHCDYCSGTQKAQWTRTENFVQKISWSKNKSNFTFFMSLNISYIVEEKSFGNWQALPENDILKLEKTFPWYSL